MDLTEGNMSQTNLGTERVRPLRFGGISMPLRPTPAYASDDDDDLGDDDSMPVEYKCPITTMPMAQPVVASDGHTYEQSAIRRWLISSNISPKTGKTLPTKTLIANYVMRALIRDHILRTCAAAQSASNSDIAHDLCKKRKPC